jgi:DNA adenine methylase
MKIDQLKIEELPTLLERKAALLDFLDNSGGKLTSFKRFATSPIRYAGGKSLAVGHIVKNLPDSIDKLISPFFGGGSVEIACSKYLGLDVAGYDIFDILVNYWQHQIENPEALYRELKKLKPEKEEFERIRLVLNDVWRTGKKLDPLTLATYYVYNFNLSYGPGFMGWASKIYLDEQKYTRTIERIRDFQPNNLYVKVGDFREVIKNNPDTFLYCDPPYHLGDDSKMFKGIYPMRNIPVHHNGFPHDELRDLLRNHRGGFILSYNDSPTIRDYYDGFEIQEPTWQYTMGQGETRIGANREKDGESHIKKSHELLIIGQPRI